MDQVGDKCTKAFRSLLAGNITYNDKQVPVQVRTPPKAILPFVTIRSTIEKELYDVYDSDIWEKMPNNHPHFDPENPNRLYIFGRERYLMEGRTVNILVFAADGLQRDGIISQIKGIVRDAKEWHYRFCANYDSGICKTTNERCDALTIVNRFSVNNQCPYSNIEDPEDPHYRNPCGHFASYDIVKVNLDRLTLDEVFEYEPPVYTGVLEYKVEVFYERDEKALPYCGFTIREDTE